MNNHQAKHVDSDPMLEDNELDIDDVQEDSLPESSKMIDTTDGKEPKKRVGAILKEAREKQGLSLEVVHESIKIPLDALRAIEEGYTVRMLSPFYYSGFVKMYAEYLHVNVAEVIEDYKQEELPKHIKQDVEEIVRPQWIDNIFTRQRKQQIVIAAGVLIVLFLLIKVVGFLTSRKPKQEAKKETVKIEAVKKEIKKVAQEPQEKVRPQVPKIEAPKEVPKVVVPVVPKAEKPMVNTPPAVLKKDVNLTVRANQNSWLRVKTDGTVVFQSTLRTGAVETWFADDEIEISGRNINQLEFELNGKLIGTLGRKDRNAKKVIITKSGLSVKQ